MAHTTEEVLEWLGRISKGEGLLDNIPLNMELGSAAIELINAPVTILPPGYLSPHFTMQELTYSDTAREYGIDNTPDAAATEQLTALANVTLEGIRTLCKDKPLVISSGYRCPEVNAMIGGADNSAHKYGCAADFVVPEFGDVSAVCHAIQPHLKELGIDQLIYENDSWVHVGRAIPPSTAPRYECLTISGSKTTSGIA